MKIFSFLILIFLSQSFFAQIKTDRKIAIFADYHVAKYDYFQFGIGFNPKNHLVSLNRNNKNFEFIGYRIGMAKNFNNNDWGINFQSIALEGTYRDGFAGLGLEFNYKNIYQKVHFSFKPLIGMAFPHWNIMYGYNFDFYSVKSERISQHELIIGLNFNLLSWK